MHGLDRVGLDGRELASHPAHVAVDRAVRHDVVIAVGAVHQLVAAVDLAGVAEQGAQDAELRNRQDHLALVPVGPEAIEVETEAAVAADLRRAIGCGLVVRPDAPQHRLDPCRQLARAERLGHVVVTAQLEADDPVDLVVARRQEHDRDARVAPERAADVGAVHLRHQDVEHDQVGPGGCESGQRFATVGRLCHP